MHSYFLIVMTAAIATIGTAGVPGSASVMSMVVLTALGLPFTGLAMVMGMDKVVDMMRTTVNVAGTLVTTKLIAGEAAVLDKVCSYQDVILTEKTR